MPYDTSTGAGVPARIKGAKNRRQWAEVWNSVYQRTGKEETAFAEANSVYNRRKKQKKSLISSLLKADDGDLYEDTGDYDEDEEADVREEITLFADYAEDGPTFDSEGKYLCGTCKLRSGEDLCTHVVSPISFETGSCRIYINGDSEDSEPLPQKLTQIESAYTERPNVKGFGCSRCMFGAEAKEEDEDGRTYWCAFWGLRVQELACCFKNTGDDDVYAPVKGNEDKPSSEKSMLAQAAKASQGFDKVTFCPLVKVDEKKREVWGVVTAEVVDKDDEICDYETTVPYYKGLVSEMSKATDGANIFPLRAMHGLTAAGKGIHITFRKEAKEIYMGFKVVDDNEWKKVQENVYTGFSQGGRYVKKWKDGDYIRYTSNPSEVSLVDVPCLTRAHFDYIKADGSIEMRKFSSAPLGATAGEIPTSPTPIPSANVNPPCTCDCSQCKAGFCQACEKGTPHPIMSEKTVQYLVRDKDGKGHLPYTKDDGKPNHRLMGAAWAALNSSGGHRGNKYEGPNKEQAKKKLKQIYAREGMDTPSEKVERIGPMIKSMIEDAIQSRAYGQLGKGMYTVSRFAQLTEDLASLWMCLEYERESEGDESPVTDDIKELYHSLLDHLLSYVEEEVDEAKQKVML